MSPSEEEAFTAFATSAYPRLCRTGFLLCGDHGRAEDAAQESLLRLYGAWHRVEHSAALWSYCRRTLTRVLVDETRRPWRREHATETWLLPDRADPAERDGRLADEDLLRRALGGLTPRRRACVVLRFYDDLSVAETADLLGVSEGTVKSTTAEALRLLRTVLSSDEPAPTGGHRA